MAERLTKKERAEAEELGGVETWDINELVDPTVRHYSEKGSHLERSLFHDKRKGGHRKHFKRRR